jgi:hypothetical protein
MNPLRLTIIIALFGLLLATPLSLSQNPVATAQILAKRGTVAISYPEK